MNLAVTRCPVAVVNWPGVVSAAWNGAAHLAFRYSASVSTQPMPRSWSPASRWLMCPRVAAAMAASICAAALSGLRSSGTCRTVAP